MPASPLSPEQWQRLPREAKLQALALLEEKARRARQRRFHHLFPDETHEALGEVFHARRGYSKHIAFFEAGAKYRERALMAANRVGKSEAGGFEIAAHLTGLYPDWWRGKRFPGPVRAWAAGKSSETTRDIVQAKLLGEVTGGGATKGVSGTGIIPGATLGRPTWKSGVPNLVDTIKVRHISGGHSLLGLKSYEQGRGSFEGTAQHVIWLDEEPPMDVYGECLIRTATTGGLVFLTFTPLAGISEVALHFMPQEARPQN